MEKRGVISPEDTPQHAESCCGGGCRNKSPAEPLTKEAADQLERSDVNDAIDAAAEATEKNHSSKN